MRKILIFFLLIPISSTRAMMKAKKDLENVCQEIWNAAGNNLNIPTELKVNLDETNTQPLFKVELAGQAKLDSEVFTTFADLLQNNADDKSQEAFLEVIIQPGGPMAKAWEYLKAKKILDPKQDREDFKEVLKELWFIMPPGKTSKGFEHVFVGERGKLGKHYDGFHNWYQFYLEQSKGTDVVKLEYLPDHTYLTKPIFMTGLKFKWRNAKKSADEGSSLFVGTSPAFDFAIFSTCAMSLFIEENIEVCTCGIHGSLLEITAKQIFTKAKGKQVPTSKINTAYPLSVVALVCTSVPPNSRTDCGWLGIDRPTCGKRGCCFDSQQYGSQTYWCYYPSDHKCHGILPQNRKDCGFLGISRSECEGKGCCFDENFGHGVPHCFQGVPKDKI